MGEARLSFKAAGPVVRKRFTRNPGAASVAIAPQAVNSAPITPARMSQRRTPMSKDNSSCIHAISIRTTPERLWEALTTPDLTREYWFSYQLESDWSVGSTWKLSSPEGRVHAAGKIVEIDGPRRIVLTWRDEIRAELMAEGYSNCTIDLEPTED